MSGTADVVVIGGGIAGVSAAYQLASDRSVVLLEREAQLAYHTTGRSAAAYIVNYGGPVAQRLTIASRAFYDQPPPGLVEGPILEPRALLIVGGPNQRADIEALVAAGRALDSRIEQLDTADLIKLVPVLLPEAAAVGLYEPGAASMDVMGLHQAYVRGARSNDTSIEPYNEVIALERAGENWAVTTDRGQWTADVVVNAAGAWGDVIGSMAGAASVGLTPMRRTAFTVSAPVDASSWPLILIEADDGPCYFKPEPGSQLLCSPADETPSEPCDARPEELDIAIAIDRINAATTLAIRSIRTSWAGLRSFVPDRNPVLGWDADLSGFCWMVGQGGTGITTSHAAGRVIANVVRGEPLASDLVELGLDLASMAPRATP